MTTRRRLTDEQRLAALEAQKAKIDARLKATSAKLKGQARKDDARRKIIAGALALEHKDAAFRAALDKLINEYVTRPDERRLFGLDPLPDSSGSDNQPAPPTVEGSDPPP